MSYLVHPEISGLSTLAKQVSSLKDVTTDRKIAVYGLAVHTSGSGIVAKALKLDIDPISYAIGYYTQPGSYSPHYVIDYNGALTQIADEHEHAQHIGFLIGQRTSFLIGDWEEELPEEFIEMWKKRWPAYKSPAHLFPGPSPNDAYIGVEMLPIDGTTNTPMKSGLKYTKEQHDTVAALAKDIASRWKLPDGWESTSRLVGHEDVNPLDRTTKNPPAGWDPGGIRNEPWIDWDYIKTNIKS